jgi:hypothetical protein
MLKGGIVMERQDIDVALPYPDAEFAEMVVLRVIIGVADKLRWLPEYGEGGPILRGDDDVALRPPVMRWGGKMRTSGLG